MTITENDYSVLDAELEEIINAPEAAPTVFDVPLANTKPEEWTNTIFYRLADALGYLPDPETHGYVLDADTILDQAIETIWRYQELTL